MKIIEKTFDVLTGQETILEREATAEEAKQRAEIAAANAAAQAEKAIKATEKAALLAKLGITDDEAKLLLS
jgi:hypothetical protein